MAFWIGLVFLNLPPQVGEIRVKMMTGGEVMTFPIIMTFQICGSVRRRLQTNELVVSNFVGQRLQLLYITE